MLYVHDDLKTWLANPRNDPRMRRKTVAVLRQMLDYGEPAAWKITSEGANKLWRRAPVGGSGGCQWYLYFAPREVLAQIAACTVSGQTGDLFLRAVRHHDDTSWALPPDADELKWSDLTGEFLQQTGFDRAESQPSSVSTAPSPEPRALPVVKRRPPLRERILSAIDNSHPLTDEALALLLHEDVWNVRVLVATLVAEDVLVRHGAHLVRPANVPKVPEPVSLVSLPSPAIATRPPKLKRAKPVTPPPPPYKKVKKRKRLTFGEVIRVYIHQMVWSYEEGAFVEVDLILSKLDDPVSTNAFRELITRGKLKLSDDGARVRAPEPPDPEDVDLVGEMFCAFGCDELGLLDLLDTVI